MTTSAQPEFVGAICGGHQGDRGRWMRVCRSCGGLRRHVVEDHGWYGWRLVCCRCGLERGEAAGARQTKRQRERSAIDARAAWATAVPMAQFEAAARQRMKEDLGR